MEQIPLGRTSLTVSRIGFGCAAIGGYDYGSVNDDDSIDAIHAAVDAGITLFDTADVYGLGHAETVLGRALGGRRSMVVIATKVGVRWEMDGRTRRDLSPAYIRDALEASLVRLRTDFVDLYQIHWPDPATPVEDTLETLERLRSEGKIRHIGCCNMDAALVDRLQVHGRVESAQLPVSLAQLEALPAAQRCVDGHGMAILAYNALAQGLFTGKYGAGSRFEGTDLRQRSALFSGAALDRNLRVLEALREIGVGHGRTPAQVAIRWLLDRPEVTCVLAGMKRPDQVQQNAGATGWRLTVEEHVRLERVARQSGEDRPSNAPSPVGRPS